MICSRSGSRQLVDDAPVGEEDDAVRVRRGHRVVGHHHHGLVVLVDAAAQERSRTSAPERESRLPVGSSAKTICGSGQGAGHGDALLLASGQLVGRCFSRSREAHRVDHLRSHAGVRLAARDRHRQRDVLLGGQGRHQVEGLEDEADLVAAQPGEPPCP